MRLSKKLGKDDNWIGFQWVLKAMDKAGEPYDFIMVKDSVITATDGKRLHQWTSNYNIPDGNYRVAKINQNCVELILSETAKAPNIDAVMPNKNGFENKFKLICTIKSFHPDVLATKAIRALNKGLAWNADYLKDLWIEDVEFRFFEDSLHESSPAWIKAESFTALIMPIYIPASEK